MVTTPLAQQLSPRPVAVSLPRPKVFARITSGVSVTAADVWRATGEPEERDKKNRPERRKSGECRNHEYGAEHPHQPDTAISPTPPSARHHHQPDTTISPTPPSARHRHQPDTAIMPAECIAACLQLGSAAPVRQRTAR
jgi:hypothetical protein